MRRTIKFRAWDVIGEKYIDASMIWVGHDPIGDQEISVLRGEPPNTFWDPNIILEQFTGIIDKNGVEIYEGDIVLLDNWEPNRAIVTFDRGGFCFYFKPDDNYYHDCKYLEGQTVIGNIHQGENK